MRFIAIQEKSAGNESVGSEWLETKSFNENTPLSEVWKWAMRQYPASVNKNGRLMIQIDSASLDDQ